MTNPFVAERYEYSWIERNGVFDQAIITVLSKHLERLNFTVSNGRIEITGLSADVIYDGDLVTLPVHHLIRCLLLADSFPQAFRKMKKHQGTIEDDKFGIRRVIGSLRGLTKSQFAENPDLVIALAAARAYASDLAYERQNDGKVSDDRRPAGRLANILRVVIDVLDHFGVSAETERAALKETRRLRGELRVLDRITTRNFLFQAAHL